MPSVAISDLSRKHVYKLLTGSVIPRPIAWVSSLAAAGTFNIAPFSFFTVVSSFPPMLGVSIDKTKTDGREGKDTLRCVRETGEFVVNIATAGLLPALVTTSLEFPGSVDEFEVTGLTPAPCVAIAAPRIREAPVSFECTLHTAVDLGSSVLIIGEVQHAHFQPGLVDDSYTVRLQPVGRMPGPTFCTELNQVSAPPLPASGLPGLPPWAASRGLAP
ncbi:flavin reductase family protein [Amycolatopsis jejuensis]|uniref:flavin reductase family protein n=1 Tax=Amycolatopsis jejuensis TaxID=330084 RepID=UPI0006897483|nr:flavin reductase family protein [Amycolatopsis jejuensis]